MYMHVCTVILYMYMYSTLYVHICVCCVLRYIL